MAGRKSPPPPQLITLPAIGRQEGGNPLHILPFFPRARHNVHRPTLSAVIEFRNPLGTSSSMLRRSVATIGVRPCDVCAKEIDRCEHSLRPRNCPCRLLQRNFFVTGSCLALLGRFDGTRYHMECAWQTRAECLRVIMEKQKQVRIISPRQEKGPFLKYWVGPDGRSSHIHH